VESAIVVVFRLPPASMGAGPEGAYLTRARSMFARAEALGGRLVAWSAAMFGVAWDPDSMEEAMLLATSIREGATAQPRAWACGIAEGGLEPLAPDGARMQLAWGEALLKAASLARIARAGEVLVDGDVRALRAGQLSLVGARAATESGQRVRGWKLDLDRPWKRAPGAVAAPAAAPDLTDKYDALGARAGDLGELEEANGLADALEPDEDRASSPTVETQPLSFLGDEVSTAEILQIVEGRSHTSVPPALRREGSLLAERVRRLVRGEDAGDPVEVLSHLRRARAEAEADGSPAARCQAALALALALALGGRSDEGLLEALDALARAREAQDTKAVGASLALLAKLYARMGRTGEAAALREAAGVE
jgi:hypothetical protein